MRNATYPKRLQICAFLAVIDEAVFQVLRDQLAVSDSALSKHLKQRQNASYVKQRKAKMAGRQRTWISLVETGRTAFEENIEELKRLANC